VKDSLKELLDEDATFAYSPTKGVEETREFLADRVNKRGKVKISKEDIIFSMAWEMLLQGHILLYELTLELLCQNQHTLLIY